MDFVVMEGMKVEQLVQVCWDINDTKTREREVAGLVEATGSIGVEEGIVVTDDYFGEEGGVCAAVVLAAEEVMGD